jgi:serine/threonine-protein kinase HipA
VGTAYINATRRTVSTSFTYDPAWQADPDGYTISPDLALATGRHQTAGLPGAIGDTAPDRWGRNLITKHLRALDRAAGATPRDLLQADFLLGASDLTRQGALRYTTDAGNTFLAGETGVPALIELPRLLRAADAVAADGDESFAAVKALLDAGTGSLGGARPKASVRDDNGSLAIAKLPHPDDEWDVMAWETTALDLAERAGVTVPVRRLVRVDGRHCLVLDRFDRNGPTRIGYVSALTLVGGADGSTYDYLEVVEALTEHGSEVKADLRELYRRIAFGLAINNTDDHLRNHGFLRARAGWRLSPVFDINPTPNVGTPAQTSVAFESGTRRQRWDALRAAAPEFNLKPADGDTILADVANAVQGWRTIAIANEVGSADLDLFEDALSGLVAADATA